MGTWSTGIYGDDEAQDARDSYREILSSGVDGTKATDRFLKEWKGALKDSDDGPVIWFALADTQWSLGRLEDRVRDEAIRIIDEGTSLDRWREAGEKLLAKRQKVLQELKKKLLSPQPRVRKIALKKKPPKAAAGKLLKPGELRKALRAMYCRLEPSRGNAISSVVCDSGMTDLLLANLEILADSLETLHISNSDSVTDDGLKSIGRLRKLKRLTLRGLEISDAGLAHLDDLDQLVHLEITGSSRVTDAGVARFAKCSGLEWVELGGTRIGDPTMAWIGKLRGVRQLWIRGTAVTDAGLAHLKNSRLLEKLFLAWTAVTDVGVAPLANLPKLEWLDVAETAVTDKAVSALCKSRSLKALDLGGTKITDACVPALLKLRLSSTSKSAARSSRRRGWRRSSKPATTSAALPPSPVPRRTSPRQRLRAAGRAINPPSAQRRAQQPDFLVRPAGQVCGGRVGVRQCTAARSVDPNVGLTNSPSGLTGSGALSILPELDLEHLQTAWQEVVFSAVSGRREDRAGSGREHVHLAAQRL